MRWEPRGKGLIRLRDLTYSGRGGELAGGERRKGGICGRGDARGRGGRSGGTGAVGTADGAAAARPPAKRRKEIGRRDGKGGKKWERTRVGEPSKGYGSGGGREYGEREGKAKAVKIGGGGIGTELEWREVATGEGAKRRGRQEKEAGVRRDEDRRKEVDNWRAKCSGGGR
jgi:hypothetical protein